MITVLSNTAKGRKLLDRAIRYDGYYLWDVYGRFSSKKKDAWEECLKMCSAEGGSDFRICSHNTDNFSVSWKVEKGW